MFTHGLKQKSAAKSHLERVYNYSFASHNSIYIFTVYSCEPFFRSDLLELQPFSLVVFYSWYPYFPIVSFALVSCFLSFFLQCFVFSFSLQFFVFFFHFPFYISFFSLNFFRFFVQYYWLFHISSFYNPFGVG